MPIIDADCHVIESDQTWAYLDPADEAYRPRSYTDPARPDRPLWVIDGNARERPFATAAKGTVAEVQSGFAQTSLATRSLADVDARIAHMDALGVDVQVLYPTVYLTQVSQKPAIDLALAKSYNRWLADIWSQSEGRLRWAAVPPLLTMDAVPEQLRFAKENGACGVFMRGFEGDRVISDPYFFPLYEAASELDMPICVHAGCGNPAYVDLTVGEAYARNKLPVITAFHSFVFHDVPSKFPALRFAFIEVSANWIPYVVTDLERRVEREGRVLGRDVLAGNRMFVACQTNDDIPYIIDRVGDDNLLIGSDYGHSDTSSELEALRSLKESAAVPPASVDKILNDNPRRLYGL